MLVLRPVSVCAPAVAAVVFTNHRPWLLRAQLGLDLLYEPAEIRFQEALVRAPKLQCAAFCLRSQTNELVSSGHVYSHMQYVWAITSYHDYHEPELQDFASELPGLGEADQRWFPHEHLSVRVCGSGACTALLPLKNK